MKPVTIIFAALAVSGTAVVWWQHESAAELKQGPEFINPSSLSNAAEPNKPTNVPVEEEIRSLRAQTRDLPKLRNEVGQLRARRADLASARAENARLLAAKRTGSALPPDAPPGFISKEQLRNAGFATPEAAVETFFWAMRESRLDLMIQSLSPNHRDRKGFESLPPETRAQQINGFSSENLGGPRVSNFNDFTVAEREQISDDTIVLSLRSSVTTKVAKYRLKRFGSEWKIEDIPL